MASSPSTLFAFDSKPSVEYNQPQDAYKVVKQLGRLLLKSTYSYFGLFDGYNGAGCSQYLANNLHKEIASTDEFARGNMKVALQLGFESCDRKFISQASHKTKDDSGACAAAVIIAHHQTGGRKLFVANCGDTVCILFRKNTPVVLSQVHKTSTTTELTRVVRAGGTVVSGNRVLGLPVTRAFGSKTLKEKKDIIIPTPGINEHIVQTDDLFLLMASSSFFTTEYEPQHAAKLAYDLLFQHDFNLKEVCNDMILSAEERDIKEDITVGIILLNSNELALHAGNESVGIRSVQKSKIISSSSASAASPAAAARGPVLSLLDTSSGSASAHNNNAPRLLPIENNNSTLNSSSYLSSSSPAGAKEKTPIKRQTTPLAKKDSSSSMTMQQQQQQRMPSYYQVTIHSASGLFAVDKFMGTDPFVVVTCGGNTWKTPTIRQTTNPVWSKATTTMNAPLDDITRTMVFSVYDDGPISKEKIGQCSISLNDTNNVNRKLQLLQDRASAGELVISVVPYDYGVFGELQSKSSSSSLRSSSSPATASSSSNNVVVDDDDDEVSRIRRQIETLSSRNAELSRNYDEERSKLMRTMSLEKSKLKATVQKLKVVSSNPEIMHMRNRREEPQDQDEGDEIEYDDGEDYYDEEVQQQEEAEQQQQQQIPRGQAAEGGRRTPTAAAPTTTTTFFPGDYVTQSLSPNSSLPRFGGGVQQQQLYEEEEQYIGRPQQSFVSRVNNTETMMLPSRPYYPDTEKKMYHLKAGELPPYLSSSEYESFCPPPPPLDTWQSSTSSSYLYNDFAPQQQLEGGEEIRRSLLSHPVIAASSSYYGNAAMPSSYYGSGSIVPSSSSSSYYDVDRQPLSFPSSSYYEGTGGSLLPSSSYYEGTGGSLLPSSSSYYEGNNQHPSSYYYDTDFVSGRDGFSQQQQQPLFLPEPIYR